MKHLRNKKDHHHPASRTMDPKLSAQITFAQLLCFRILVMVILGRRFHGLHVGLWILGTLCLGFVGWVDNPTYGAVHQVQYSVQRQQMRLCSL